MVKFSARCTAAIAAIVATGFSGTAYAITTFAQMYNMKCDACHTTVPKLNEFGVAFMAKGFVLPSQDGGEMQGDKHSPKGEVAGTSDAGRVKGKELGKVGESGSEAKDVGMADAESKGGAGEETTALPAAEPPPPTVVYKVPTRDGSVYFTDNPERKGRLVSDQELESGEKKPESERNQLIIKKRQVAITPRVQRTAPKTDAVAAKPERYRNYAECMEKQLDGAAQPESAQEAMDLFVTAEKKCASYQTEKR